MAVVVTALLVLGSMLLGEGPHWVANDQSLMMVDILGGYVYRYYTEESRVQRIKMDEVTYGQSPSIIASTTTDDQFIIALRKTLTLVQTSGEEASHIYKGGSEIVTAEGEVNERFNDGKCDPQGRFWGGVMAEGSSGGGGYLYKLEQNLTLTTMLTDLTIPNGLAWSSDRTKFFYVDTPPAHILVFDYDDAPGTISNRQVLFDFVENGLLDQTADGLTIDTDDNLWAASYGGSQILNINTTNGELIRTINIPSRQVTSCAFGGPDYSTLYVTTAAIDIPKSETDEFPYTGHVFEVTGLGVQGLPPNNCVYSLLA